MISAKACCTAALPGFVHTAPVGTRGTLVLLLWQISSRGGSCAACITPQAASLSFAFQSRAIWAASLFFKNTFLVFQYWHLQLQCMVLSYTSYVALACADCCRNTWEIILFLKKCIYFLLYWFSSHTQAVSHPASFWAPALHCFLISLSFSASCS